ncbi:MAG TPA: hypothetical protein VN253_14205 [Kofleriaceae bacterium]|nr:hypothetical protein [Kofleriaceae bacterium]
MNGSSCPTCGWVLRWLPEQNAWGCDRCRKLVPVPGPMHGGPMHGGPMGAAAPAGGTSSKGLVLGLAGGAVAVTGIIIAVVVATRGGGGGAGSRDDLVKSTLAAMTDGDVDKLVKLSDPVGLYEKAVDCSERDKAKQDKDAEADDKDKEKDKDKDADSDDDDPAIQAKRVRRKHEKMVEEIKGMKLELVSIKEKGDKEKGDKKKGDDDDKDGDSGTGTRMKKGTKAGKGCVFKTDLRMHELTATVRVTEGQGEPAEQEASLFAIEVDGGWYLAMPPTLRAGVGALERELKKYRDKMCACKDAACADEVQKDYKDWTRSQRDAAEKLSKSDRRPLDEIDDELKACRRKLREGDADEQVRQAIAKMEDFKSQMCQCTDKPCADRVSKEMQEWAASMASKTDVKPSRAEDMKRLSELGEEMGKCMAKAMTSAPTDDPPPPPPGDPPAEDPGAGGTLASLPACAEYRRQIDKIRACPKYPPTSVATIQRSYDQLEKSWASKHTTAAARQQMNRTCEMIVDSLKKSLAVICP